MARIFSFPNPVNEVAARVVAAGVVALALTYLLTGHAAVLAGADAVGTNVPGASAAPRCSLLA